MNIDGLLVDDDPLYLRTLQRSLARREIETVTAHDIASALEQAKQAPPAFALIDLKVHALQHVAGPVPGVKVLDFEKGHARLLGIAKVSALGRGRRP